MPYLLPWKRKHASLLASDPRAACVCGRTDCVIGGRQIRVVQVSRWSGSILLRLLIPCYCFLLLLVPPAHPSDALNTLRDTHSHDSLPPSPALYNPSKCTPPPPCSGPYVSMLEGGFIQGNTKLGAQNSATRAVFNLTSFGGCTFATNQTQALIIKFA